MPFSNSVRQKNPQFNNNQKFDPKFHQFHSFPRKKTQQKFVCYCVSSVLYVFAHSHFERIDLVLVILVSHIANIQKLLLVYRCQFKVMSHRKPKTRANSSQSRQLTRDWRKKVFQVLGFRRMRERLVLVLQVFLSKKATKILLATWQGAIFVIFPLHESKIDLLGDKNQTNTSGPDGRKASLHFCENNWNTCTKEKISKVTLVLRNKKYWNESVPCTVTKWIVCLWQQVAYVGKVGVANKRFNSKTVK